MPAQLIEIFATGYDKDGAPVALGTVEVYEAGTSTPAAVWYDRAKTSPTAGGVTSFTLDAQGRKIVYGDDVYKFVVKDAAGVTLATIDDHELASVSAAISAALPSGSRRLIDVQVFTSTGTWTKPAGCTAAKVRVVGGGGGGAGAATTTSTQQSIGGSGGGGGYSEKFITSGLGATETVTVAAGGAGGATGANNGSAGGASSFGAHLSASGGDGGAAQAATNSPALGGGGGPGGVASGGNINIQGGSAASGGTFSASAILAVNSAGGTAAGGFSNLARQSGVVINGTSLGAAANGYGAGGGAGANIGTQGTGVAGSAGSAGIVIVESYT